MDGVHSSRSGNREISVFRDPRLEENLSHKAHIEYGAAVLSSCSSSPPWLKRILLIWPGLKKKIVLA